MQVPTLLVGLGGLGSKIVDEVYNLVPKDQRDRVAVLSFDTNINDIKKLKHIRKSNVIQTSTTRTVRQYLANTDKSVKEWFPNEQGEILRKSLTDGAGQVRAVSRLAYRASIEEGKMAPLIANLNRIFRINDTAREASPRVMIVTTLAGGTGAGLFLQVALYIRDILESVYNRQNVLIRGTFLLPDILVNTGKIKRGQQQKNIRANAYACIKELNAITRNAQGEDNRMTIELEYKPNQVDIEGRLRHNMTSMHLPYDFCFMYDFENIKGENLQYFDNYLNQVIKTTYLDLFSPITAGRFSKQDNQIIELIEDEGLSRYCGGGAATIEFPYNDMIEYCGLSWVTDSLSKDWLKLDDQYRKDMREYKKALEMGGTLNKPHRGERFSFHLEKLATGENPKPFFRKVYSDAYSKGKGGELGRAKPDLFIQAIEQEIDRLISTDKKLNALQNNLELDNTRIKNRKHSKDEVIDMEEALAAYKRAVLDFISKTKNYLINQIVLADEDAPGMMEGKSYHLNTWVLGSPEPVHPITVRYMLYNISIHLERLIGNLEEDNQNTFRSIKDYNKVFDDPETDDIIEDAEMRMEQALEQGIMSRAFKNQFKEFIKIYREHSTSHRQNLSKYLKNKLTADVYIGVNNAINILIKDFERFFENMEEVKDRLMIDKNLLGDKHDNSGDPTRIFVLAKREQKDKIWEDASLTMVSSELPVEISEQIYGGQYKRFCEKQQGKFINEEKPEKVEAMIRKDVLQWSINQLRKEDRLDFNVIRALQKEAEFKGIDEENVGTYMKEQISRLNSLANPLVPRPFEADYTVFDTWGIHPDCLNFMDEELRNDIFDDVTDNPAFSSYEIIRSKTVYGLTIDDFTKFHCGDEERAIDPGAYYMTYRERINKLEKSGKTITPHLDKRWHSPYYLPEIHEVNVVRTSKNIIKALTYGLALGVLEATQNDGEYSWEFHGKDYTKWVTYGDKPTEGNFYSLYKALTQNMGIVDSVIEHTDAIFKKDRRKHAKEADKYQFVERCTKIYYPPAKKEINILDIFLSFYDYHSFDAADNEIADKLIRGLFDEVKEFYVEVYGASQEKTAKKEALSLFKARLARYSSTLKKADANSKIKKLIKNLMTNF